jgi:TrmH family RNA methyltransferase
MGEFMIRITSVHNVRVKQISALQTRQERERTGLFFVEGVRTVLDALEAQATIELLVVAPEILKSETGAAAVDTLCRAGMSILEVSAEVFGRLACTAALKYGWQGLGAVVRQRWVALPTSHDDSTSYWVALDAIQDPGNLGTILRTCEATGATGVILLGSTTDPHDPQAVRASMGAVFSQRMVRASWEQFMEWKETSLIGVIGTSGSSVIDYRTVRYPSRMVLLMGSERRGLSVEQQQRCDAVVSIPMVGSVNSLNLGVATGIVLYEIFEQHRLGEHER